MRYLTVVVLSALLIWFAPSNLNNSTKQTTKPAAQATARSEQVKQETLATAPEPDKPVETIAAKKVETPAPHKQVANGCDAYRRMIARYDWNVSVMTAVMRAESSCNPYAVNTHNYDGVYDYGLLQLHGQRIYDPAENIAAAYRLWRVQGYEAWTAYTNGNYARYL